MILRLNIFGRSKIIQIYFLNYKIIIGKKLEKTDINNVKSPTDLADFEKNHF